jgi:hypothetical protein
VFTVGEQEFFAQKGFDNKPVRGACALRAARGFGRASVSGLAAAAPHGCAIARCSARFLVVRG